MRDEMGPTDDNKSRVSSLSIPDAPNRDMGKSRFRMSVLQPCSATWALLHVTPRVTDDWRGITGGMPGLVRFKSAGQHRSQQGTVGASMVGW